MRLSKKQHPVAVLRTFLGLGQKELADLVDCSMPTIQSVELRRLKLSEDLALRIVDQTYVDLAWLLEGDPKVAPLNERKKPYRREDYERAQARLRHRREPPSYRLVADARAAWIMASGYQKRIKALIEKASRKGRREIIDWQIDNALTQIERRYGIVYNRKEEQAFREAAFPGAFMKPKL